MKVKKKKIIRIITKLITFTLVEISRISSRLPSFSENIKQKLIPDKNKYLTWCPLITVNIYLSIVSYRRETEVFIFGSGHHDFMVLAPKNDFNCSQNCTALDDSLHNEIVGIIRITIYWNNVLWLIGTNATGKYEKGILPSISNPTTTSFLQTQLAHMSSIPTLSRRWLLDDDYSALVKQVCP